ncbi:hypothetical protein GQ55_6G045800 [Panicum hallii var. hallii]|uniref:Uncharacterized protein n=1 Tax=Panicum hallii var. hallii TaxID=1504633 RepID=A0A2T7D3V5_9POAL|nr:hypothetical protein GQ55_6G045800 [Panicum hallii var. hallii]
MARATAPSRRPPSAVASAAPSPPPARVPLPQRRASLASGGVRSHPKGAPPSALPAAAPPRRRAPSCACSPTTHPGSFRCALHRGHAAPPPVSSRLSAPRRASMANPLVRIAAVEGGDQIRRALASLPRPPPSSQQQQHRRRAGAFRPRPSRLSAASSAADDEDKPSPRPEE